MSFGSLQGLYKVPQQDREKTNDGTALGALTKSDILTRSGGFDLESVFSLKLSDCALQDVSATALTQCANLTRLDLSNNALSHCRGLESCGKLTSLNLNNNRIYDIESVSSLSALRRLDLSGNALSSLSSLSCLSSLQCLTHLYLVSPDQSSSNPVALSQSGAYRSAVRRMLPSLLVLDGERLQCPYSLRPDGKDQDDIAAALNISQKFLDSREAWFKLPEYPSSPKKSDQTASTSPTHNANTESGVVRRALMTSIDTLEAALRHCDESVVGCDEATQAAEDSIARAQMTSSVADT